MPSASLYQKIGMAHYQLAQYELALEAFKKARKLDVNYNTDQIALGITFCSFQLAGTVEQHRKCAKKLACYFSSLGKKSPQPGALRLVEELNTLGFSVPMGHENLAHETPSEKPDEATSKSLVPPEIKEKIIAAMQNPFFWADLPMDREQPSTEEYKLDPKEFVPINESGTLKGKISHKVALSVEERNKFQTALETGRLLPANSKGISGVKRKGNDLYIKISRSGLRLFAKKYFSYQDTESNQLVRMANFDRLKRKHS
jgi:tetratricopeptide (TPR) repeat protein